MQYNTSSPVIGSHKNVTTFDGTAEKIVLFGGHKYNLFSRDDMYRLTRDASKIPEHTYSRCDGGKSITVIDLDRKDRYDPNN